MTTLRQAAQQALEALAHAVSRLDHQAAIQDCDEAITTLRAALAEQCTHGVEDSCKECYMAEPVAWMDREGDLYKMPEIKNWAPPHTMLYTAPPQRKPLTDEQRADILTKYEAYEHEWDAPEMLIDMVEAAHGIGEKE